MRLVVLALFAVAVGIATAPPTQAAAAVDLVPHEALYSLTLDQVKLGEDAESGDGQFLLRVERRCTSWVLVTQLEFTLDFGGGRALAIESSGNTEESLDGRSLRFTQEKRLNGQIVEAFKGRGALVEEGEEGLALFDLPPDLRITLPPGTMFPVASAFQTVENYKKGEKFQSYLLFNGDTIEGPHLVTEVVTGTVESVDHEAEGDTELLEGAGWRVVVSFFDFGAQDAEPNAVQRGEVLANGVIPWFSIDMGAVEAGARLVSVRALKEPEC